MLAGIILGASLVIAMLMIFGTGRFALRGDRQLVSFSIIGFGIAAAIAVVVFTLRSGEPGAENRFFNSGISTAEFARGVSSLRSPQSTVEQVTNVASVPSLIDGLRRKLETEPDNASGWALLAQSYAFTGNSELAEEALARAVELGLDEGDLRKRVDGATRGPHSELAPVLAR